MNNFITDYTTAQLESLFRNWGEPAYRARQLLKRVYEKYAWSYDEITDLPGALREKLAKRLPLHTLALKEQVEADDGTMKGLFTLRDGSTVEAALMRYQRDGRALRTTVCVSAQVGCAVGCPFCATGQQGFERNLSHGEIIDQVLYFARLVREEAAAGKNANDHVTNVVFMGMGEPLANYDELMASIAMLNAPEAFGLGARNMTVSTAGMVPQIVRLAGEPYQLGLAVSLHAGSDDVRNRLVPLNRKYPLKDVINACREYYRISGRRVSFEYVVFAGLNDSLEEARALAGLIRGLNCHVNLIPANSTENSQFRPPPLNRVLAFQEELRQWHITTTVRHSRGRGIDAGCGQLRSRIEKR